MSPPSAHSSERKNASRIRSAVSLSLGLHARSRALDATPNDLLGLPPTPSARPDDMNLLAQELLQSTLDLLRQSN